MSALRQKSIMARQRREKALMLDQLKKTPIVQMCCEKLGIGRTTYYDWRKNDPDFAKTADEALQAGTLLMNDMAESQLLAAIRDGNLGAITYWLKHRHPTYASRLQVTAELKQEQSLTPEQESLVLKALELMNITDPESLSASVNGEQ
ncbi:MAG: Uncharacterized protein G01um101425_381 [Candidatus Peregrinibacteria bacterium Gr01-1014_25]|nr:MAG: Uncharacterized protein G01um101425_381 [Candidatus Peregrinibacteria bacterium Gr01-1014_25]